VLVPPKSGRAIQIRAGEIVDVIDIDGNQVGDLWAIDAVDHRRWLSTSHTRDKLERLLPFVGESFVDQQYDPILELVADTSPGIHDMLFPACNPALYAREGLAGHVNCADNFLAAARTVDVALPVLPDPVNLFQNSRPGIDSAAWHGSTRPAGVNASARTGAVCPTRVNFSAPVVKSNALICSGSSTPQKG